MGQRRALTETDRQRYEWQLRVQGFGAAEQERLKSASVLVSRVGGVGGAVAYQLAAAGVGRLVLAHAGKLEWPDLNRQLLMAETAVGSLRVEQAARRLREFNSTLDVVPVAENISDANVDRLIGEVDVVASCAPRFGERLRLNRAAVKQKKPLVDCAMFELEVQLTTVIPGKTPCLACLFPEEPSSWTREFPVFGAVAGTVGALGAMEIIKVLTGFAEPLTGAMLLGDLRDMTFRKVRVQRRSGCPECGAM
jgi:molybdopterin-synthase adenylyltransferase